MNRFEGRGYDDEEESGPADKEKSKKQPPSDDKEGRYHSLRFVEPGHHELLNLQQRQAHGVLGGLMKRNRISESEKHKKEDEEEDEDDEEKKEKERLKKEKERKTRQKNDQTAEAEEPGPAEEPETAVVRPEAAATVREEPEYSAPVHEPAREEPEELPETSVPAPSRESPPGASREPGWLKQDREKFNQMMKKEYGEEESFKEAAMSESNDEPGEPPAAELTTNPNVSLEPEPTHSVEGFHPQGAGQQYEGYVPGSAQSAESTSQSLREQADQFAQKFSESAQASRQNIPAPQAVSRPLSRESTPDLSRRFDRLNLRQKMAISLLFTAAVAGYFANKRRKKEINEQKQELGDAVKEQREASQNLTLRQQELQKRFTGQESRLESLKDEQRRAQEESGRDFAARTQEFQPPPPAETFQRPQGAVLPPAQEIALASPLGSKEQEHESKSDAEAARRAVEEAMAEPEQPEDHKHVEQDAWLRHVIDDRTGREVTGAVRHGHEYEEERSRETFAGRPSFDRTKHSGTGTPVFTGDSQQSGQPQPVYDDQALASGEVEPGHSLPPGMQSGADLNHRLPEEEKRNPVVEALTSPWLFLLLSLLLLAYFIATLF